MPASVPPRQIEVEIEGRRYGAADTPKQKYEQPLPPALEDIRRLLENRSALLALQPESGPARSVIFDAYGNDHNLLFAREREFRNFLRAAVYHSLRRPSPEDWKELREQIPAMEPVKLMALPHTRAALDDQPLLAYLQDEFRQAAERLPRSFAFWLQLLVELEFIGLAEWAGADVCRYHYFRHEFDRTVLESKTGTVRRFDPLKRFGERHEDLTLEHQRVRTRQFVERHVHHVVKVTTSALAEYAKKVPPRVRDFLTATPLWLRPSLRIVDGQITMEEIFRSKVDERTNVKTEVKNVYKYSPGILLGAFNLLGWSADDFTTEGAVPTGLWSDRPPKKRRFWF